MGVRMHEVEKPFEGNFELLSSIRYPRGEVAPEATNGWLLDGKINEGFLAVNRLLRKGYAVHRISEPIEVEAKIHDPGSFYIPKADGVEDELEKLSKRCHVQFTTAPAAVKSKQIKMLKIGMYQRYYGGNADEGWTRWLLEQYRFRYRTIMDKDIQRGKLASKYYVIRPTAS